LTEPSSCRSANAINVPSCGFSLRGGPLDLCGTPEAQTNTHLLQ
jgi:hypothetical protein